MVIIAVNNFNDSDSLGIYELPKGSLIIDLKAEIEATEGIPIGHQRLLRKEYNNQDLKNNESLDSLLSRRGSSKPIVYLVQARIFCFCRRLLERDTKIDKSEEPQEKTIEADVDLDEPVRTSFLWGRLRSYYTRKVPDPFGIIISVLGSDGQSTISISDLDQSFSYYGICNGDTIYITNVPWNTEGVNVILSDSFTRPPPDVLFGSGTPESGLVRLKESKYDGKGTIVRAKFNWNGEIMHPYIKGLLLKDTAFFAVFKKSSFGHDSPGWLYGSPISPSQVNSARMSRYFCAGEVEGYFPEDFVSPVNETIEEHLEVTTSTETPVDVPQLPFFHFPPADGMTFRVPISDKGHSFLKFTVNYECISSPVDPTHVTISLLCTTHGIRRVSAVTVFIRIPDSALLDVQVSENETHQKEIHTDKEITETWSKGKHFDGLNIGTHGTTVGFQGGVSRNYSHGGTEKGQKVSRRKVTVGVDKEDTVFWNLKAPTSKLDEDGLDGEESITLVLKKKPVQFKYRCRVTHARDGIEKITERMNENWSWWNLLYDRAKPFLPTARR